ncbi:MAG: hypothetical protein KGQ46_02500 [Hyphomicrobiales bacterium]|nr:hypothetical protein [Hyphomicrobiales bacterium]MDE2114976.1 hypothetical protein [Hyphomicrobiales bacterium]
MLFVGLLRQLHDDSALEAFLAGHGDDKLFARIKQTAEPYGEGAAEYVTNAVRRYSNGADNDEWQALMTALGKSQDPGYDSLIRILNWALGRDADELRHEAHVAKSGILGAHA